MEQDTAADVTLSTPMSPEEPQEEGKLIRRLQLMMNLVMQTIAQDSSLSIDEASQMIADERRAALAMFLARNSPTTSSGADASSASCANASASCSSRPPVQQAASTARQPSPKTEERPFRLGETIHRVGRRMERLRQLPLQLFAQQAGGAGKTSTQQSNRAWLRCRRHRSRRNSV